MSAARPRPHRLTPSILVIDHSTPATDRDAASYAVVQEIRLFQSLGLRVTFLPHDLEHRPAATEHLIRAGVECISRPTAASLQEFLQVRGRQFRAIYVTRYWLAAHCVALVRALAPQAKLILNVADVHFLRLLRGARQTRASQDFDSARAVREAELAIMRQVDLVLSYSYVEEAVIFSQIADTTQVSRCPWVVDVRQASPSFEQRQGVAFLGYFGHRPNVDAAIYFVRELLPRIRKLMPTVPFTVYGSGVTPALAATLLRHNGDNVKVVGWVADVSQVYTTCRVFVAPLRWGAGLKGKVIDALGFGTPSVLSPIAAEGTGVRSGQEAFIASTPEEWVASILKLHQEKEIWERMSMSARSYAAATYSFANGREVMRRALGLVDIPTRLA